MAGQATANSPAARGDRAGWIYVAGQGRSGTTLLGTLLAQSVNAFDCGELHHLWEWTVRSRLCTCGAPMTECEVWSSVAGLVRERLDLRTNEEVHRLSKERVRQRQMLAGRVPPPSSQEVALRDAMETAVEQVTGATTVVDSSKMSPVLWAAMHIERPLTVVHMLRDPRAVAHSWANPRQDPSLHGELMMRKSAWRSAASWDLCGWTTTRLLDRVQEGRYVEVRYEELVADPATEIGRIPAPVDGQPIEFLPDAEASSMSNQSHAIAGNPRRFAPGPVKSDMRWQSGTPLSSRVVCTLVTLPLLRRFGYPVLVRRAK